MSESLQMLLDETAVASLAVLEAGSPAISLVPYVLLWDPLRIYLLVSDLSSHTGALRADPRCSLLIHASPSPDDARDNHALTRVTITGSGRFLDRDQATEAEARYRAKYPAIAETLLGLGDFHFCEITPSSGSFIQGFGRAYRLRGSNLEVLEHVTGK